MSKKRAVKPLSEPAVECSFCGINVDHPDCGVMICTPPTSRVRAFICNTCVSICVAVVSNSLIDKRKELAALHAKEPKA